MVPQPTRSNRSIGRVLALLAVISVPQIGLTALALSTFGEEARLRRELLFRHEAIVLRDAIDQEFARLFATTEALAASPSITTGDVQAFRQKALGMRDVVAAEVTLASSDGTVLVDTRASSQGQSADHDAMPPLERRLMKGPRVQIVRAQNDQAGRSLIVAAPIKTAGSDQLTHIVSLHLSLDRFGQISTVMSCGPAGVHPSSISKAGWWFACPAASRSLAHLRKGRVWKKPSMTGATGPCLGSMDNLSSWAMPGPVWPDGWFRLMPRLIWSATANSARSATY